MDKMIVKNTIVIKAKAQVVWDTLINPKQTQKYMFGCSAISTWSIGSPLLWNATYEGKEMTFVKGLVLEFIPNKRLKYTVIDPNSDMPDIPSNYLNVTYDINELDGISTLTVTQDGFEHAANGEKRYQETYNNGEGWNPILVQIKDIVELHKPITS